MAETTTKKYLNLEGLQNYDAKIKALIKNKDDAVLAAAEAYADGLADHYDPAGTAQTKVEALANGAVKTNTEAIAKLNGADTEVGSVAYAVKAEADRATAAEQANAAAIAAEKTRAEGAEKGITDRLDVIEGTGEGSIKKAATDAVAKVVANAPEDFDTLKEVADWIANDTTGAAKMQSDIATLMGDDTKDGSVAKALKDAKAYADSLDTAMDSRVDALEAAIGENGSVASQIATEIGKLDATVSNIEGALTGDGVKVTVTQTDGKITAVAAEVEVSAEVEAAKADAISTAAADATSKANAAKSEAIADAAADATTKANTAKNDAVTEAKGYTDQEIAKFVAISDTEINALFPSTPAA